MVNSYESLADCIIKHSVKILNGNYDNSDEIFDYAQPDCYPEKVVTLAEKFGMMMVKLEAREFQLNETILQLKAKEQEIRRLYQAFVETIVAAIDARDTATAGHSKRMATYSAALCRAINDTDYGEYQFIQFSDNAINELYYAALLHDVGKIGVREQILLKKHRLSDERMLVIQYRFKYYKQCLLLKEMTESLNDNDQDLIKNIDHYYSFISQIKDKEYISEEEEKEITRISKLEFVNAEGTTSKILDNFEKNNLLVKRGNLTAGERSDMNMHVTYTAEILQYIPWEHSMQQIAFFAAGHHEKMDGSGYPQGLAGKDIPIQVRMLMIVDIFDALTAFDRPYKPPMSVENAIEVLKKEVMLGKLDKDIVEIFCDKVVGQIGKSEIKIKK